MLVFFIVKDTTGQVGINEDGNNPNPAAMLDVRSTDKGFLLPRMTSVQRDAISAPPAGLVIYNTDVNMFQGYNGTIWQSIDFTSCAPGQPGTITGNATPICNETGVAYSIAAVTGASAYNWTVPSGATIAGGQGTTSITVNFSDQNGNVSVRAESNCGTSAYRDLAITLQPPPQPGTITGNQAPACYGSASYSISPVAGATYYHWTVPLMAGVISGQGTTAITVMFFQYSGNVSVRAESNCGNSAYSDLAITLQPPAQPGPITGPSEVCAISSYTYSISAVPGALSYNWQVPMMAVINSGQGTTSINVTFNWVSGNVSVCAQNGCGSSTYRDLAVTLNQVPSQPGSISGNATPDCQATGVPYSISAVSGATSYNWTVPSGATIAGGQGTTGITVDFGTNSGNVSVCAQNFCGNSSYSNLAISMAPGQPGGITGLPDVCGGATGVSYSITAVPGATGYNWTVPVGSTVSSGQGTTSITVSFGNNSGNVSVCAQNACGNGQYRDKYVIVTLVPALPGTITGNSAPVCMATTEPYSIDPVPGATSYNWTVPPGATISGGQGTTYITVNFGTQSGNVSVRAINDCGMSSYRNLPVSVIPPSQPGPITGPVNVCVGALNVPYSVSPVAGASSYNWTVPAGATVSGGQGTNSVTVSFGSASGNVSVRAQSACGNSSYRDLAVTVTPVPSMPGAITGQANVCAGASGVAYSISPVPGATEYNWTVPSGSNITGGQGTTSITVNFGSTSGNVSVNAENQCGNSPDRILAVTVITIPAQPGSITGTATPYCQQTGVPYSIASVPGATSYSWTVPSGADIISGQGTTNITVNFGTQSGNVSVQAINICGSSSFRNLAVTISAPAQPGPITGPNIVDSGETGVSYSISAVTGATSYNWTVPPGATVAGGQGTTSITVNFGTQSGNVSVRAQSVCGNSPYRDLWVTVETK